MRARLSELGLYDGLRDHAMALAVCSRRYFNRIRVFSERRSTLMAALFAVAM